MKYTATREIIDLAAKAGDIDIHWYDGEPWTDMETRWDPENDCSEALRLAARLKMDIVFDNGLVNVFCTPMLPIGNFGASEIQTEDTSSICLAITRCAAEVGRAMQ